MCISSPNPPIIARHVRLTVYRNLTWVFSRHFKRKVSTVELLVCVSSSLSPTKYPAPSTVFSIPDNGNFILLGAWIQKPEVSLDPFLCLTSPDPVLQQILLVPPSKHIQDPSTSHHLHCHHSSLRHHGFCPGSSPAP